MSAGSGVGNRIVRYEFGERMVHTITALSYVYLLLTGLAFWTPALYWLAIVFGGGYLSRVMHPWVGLVFSAAVAVMFVRWRDAMRTTQADRAWRRAIRDYIANRDDRMPPAGRFNYGQKQLFWLMVWGALALLVSGVVLWVPQMVPGSLAMVRQAALLIHAVAALVTIGGFIVHVYMGVAVVPGGVRAIVNGDVSEEWARHHHPLWHAELRKACDSRAD